MEKNLFSLFPSFETITEYPSKPQKDFYVFQHEEKENWFKINKKEVSKRDYTLLTTLFTEIKLKTKTDSISQKWLLYLENGGNAPFFEQKDIRVIQLFFEGQGIDEANFRKASSAFFGDSIHLVSISAKQALIVEVKSCTAHEPETFFSYMSVLESDFYLKVKLYIGKFQTANSHFHSHFKSEKEWFQKAMAHATTKGIYTMEDLFPIHLIEQMPQNTKELLVKEVLIPLAYNQEILQTVRAFFENGLNASVASKKLYIHRNTLQYRLNKFQEITGISLRDFNGALVAYCASMMAYNRS